MRFALPVLLFLFAPLTSGALKYLPGNDARPLLRRDLIPLDTDSIRELADHLALVADGPFPQSASQLRHRAQLLTLSQRLVPNQLRARAIEEALLNGKSRPKPDDQEAESAKKALLEYTGWLTESPDDSEGHHLGQLLLDVLDPIAPGAVVLQKRDPADATKRWEGVVAEEARFDPQQKPAPETTTPETTNSETTNSAKYAVTALLTEVPMVAKSIEEGAQASPGVVTTSLIITEAARPEPEEGQEPSSAPPGGLVFQPEIGFDSKPLYQALVSFFENHLEPLPVGHHLNINTDKLQYLAKNRENIAANIAMLLDAAVSGKPLRSDTLLFARLRADGSLHKPVLAWEILLRIEELVLPIGTRIIVGQGMMEEMNAMLVLNKASFFTKYEVIEASTFAEARELFYENGQLPADLQAAREGYLPVRDKAMQENNLGTFLSHSAVEDRLVKASKICPRHLSAKMLATQAIRRPAYFTRYMFAQELNRLLEPISRFEYQIDQTSERAAKDAYKQARESLDPLKRLLTRQEIDILDDALNILKALNSIGRGASAILENEEEIRKRDLDAFQKDLKTFRDKLRQIYEPSPVKEE